MSGSLPTNPVAAEPLSVDVEIKPRAVLAAAVRPANKAALFDALARAGITRVIVAFDGAGDSGQIESMLAYAGEAVADLPGESIALSALRPDGSALETQSCPVAEAIETMVYDCLAVAYGGWANDDGAFGSFTFDVAACGIRLAYDERYTAYEHSEHAF